MMEQEEEYFARILKALVYIEDNLDDDLTLKELAKVSHYSPFHFHRVFEGVVGETVHRYVKRIRLERAASRLRHTQQPVTDIALDANYDTSSAFTRAFKQCMGESPRHYRNLYKEVIMMAKKLSELPNINADRIESIGDINLLFARRTGSYATSSQSAWAAMLAFVDASKLDKTKLRYFSITHDNPEITSEERLRFDACIQKPPGIDAEGEIGRQSLKGGRYAVFTFAGPLDTIDKTYDQIFLKWLPNSKERLDDTRPTFCEHFNLEFAETDPSKLVTTIHLPLA